ncbi:MAG: hypothetical protein KA150_06420, partial [Propionivibrio sp.]|nr:hypothetical protein [Propionivibrio sp.]
MPMQNIANNPRVLPGKGLYYSNIQHGNKFGHTFLKLSENDAQLPKKDRPQQPVRVMQSQCEGIGPKVASSTYQANLMASLCKRMAVIAVVH